MKLLSSLVVFLSALVGATHAQLAEKKVLTLEAAEKVAAAAEAEAKRRNATVVIAVVDDGGYPVIVKRLNDTQVASVDVGIGKARTAAIFRRSTKVFEDQIRSGRTASLVLPGATPLQGGVPLLYDGKIVGAIGVSGNTPQEDEEIALAGAAAIAGSQKEMPSKITYFPAKQVSQAFVKGMPLIEIENYKVHASHRDEPGIAEIHTRDTDIIYVLEGAAIFVTGGTAVEPKTIAPEEIRGKEIRGGEARRLMKGDIIIVPNGVPHWFKEVSSPFNYYVVKVRSEK
ncbi:MAG TPA: heme-binding protein [Candidatus Acidoferrales bacterium]|nr:heme-binding protein [Candidatus Acidoferrales bacterium]